MTEQEANAHMGDLNRGEDAIDRVLYFAKLTARLLNMMAGSGFFLGKKPFPDSAFDPWSEKPAGEASLSDAEYIAAVERRAMENQSARVREE